MLLGNEGWAHYICNRIWQPDWQTLASAMGEAPHRASHCCMIGLWSQVIYGLRTLWGSSSYD